MTMSKELLDHAENVRDRYEVLVDKIPTEEKIIMAHEAEQTLGLEPWEISEIVQGALNELPEGLEDHVDTLFDVVYDAVAEALDRARA
jgi:hypothetical protein